MRLLGISLCLLFSCSAWSHDASEIKTAACSDPLATTFARLDRTNAVAIMYGVFYRRPSVSNSYVVPASDVQYVAPSDGNPFGVYNTQADSEAHNLKGMLSLSFDTSVPLESPTIARVSFVDANGVKSWSDLNCRLSF